MSKMETLLRPLGKILGFEQDVKPPPKPPTVADKSVVEEKERQRLAMAARRGFQSTVLTPPTGAPDTGTVERKTLLGS